MEKKQNVPALRFPDFSGEWNTYTLESMCDVFTDGDWIEAGDQSNSGIRLLQTGNIGVTEYIDKPKHKKWISKETFDRLHCTAVLPGDILISRLPEPAGRACVIPDLGMEMITAVDCTIARVTEEYSKKYLVQYLSTDKYFSEVKDCLAGGTRQRISRGNLSVFTIPVPAEKTEQDRIGDFFERLDNCITVKKRKLQKLKQFRQAMLTKLFPREGAAEPELRFRGFYNKWTIESFENLVSRVSIMDNDPELPHVEYEDIISGAGALNKNIYKKSSSKTGIKFSIGDVLYGKLRPYLKNWLFATFPGIAVGDFWVLHPEKVAGKFLYYLIQSTGYQNLANMTTGTKMPRADWAVISKAKFIVPNDLAEQERIGDFLYQLDSYISLQQKKLERMQRLKAALLEKLFV